MAKAQRNSLEQIEQGRKKLRGLPDKKAGKTRVETVDLLAADIRKAVEQGYTLKEIRDVLAQSGVSVSLARMQTLLGEGKEKDKPPVADTIQDVTEPAQKKSYLLLKQVGLHSQGMRIRISCYENFALPVFCIFLMFMFGSSVHQPRHQKAESRAA